MDLSLNETWQTRTFSNWNVKVRVVWGEFAKQFYMANHFNTDVNECLSPLLNTCPSTSKCVNLNGSYRCDCVSSGSDNGTSDDNSIKTCSDLCIFNGVERRNKEKWPKSSKEQCTYCQCLDGVVTCKPIQCNCNDDDIDLHCCPECKSNGKMCRHQENKNIFYKNGQQWNYDCQTCECMVCCELLS